MLNSDYQDIIIKYFEYDYVRTEWMNPHRWLKLQPLPNSCRISRDKQKRLLEVSMIVIGVLEAKLHQTFEVNLLKISVCRL